MWRKIKKRTKLSAQITVEASLVVPIIMLVITLIIYISFYLHDNVVIKSQIYSKCLEIDDKNKNQTFTEIIGNSMNSINVFILEGNAKLKDKNMAVVKSRCRGPIQWINKIISDDYEVEIEYENSMNTRVMYACKSVCDEVKKQGSQ